MENPEARIAEAIKAQSGGPEQGMETVAVKLPPDVMDYLRDTARKRGLSTGDALRMALGTQKYLAQAVDAGGKVLISGKNGTTDVAI